jgi:hypothetical protein
MKTAKIFVIISQHQFILSAVPPPEQKDKTDLFTPG